MGFTYAGGIRLGAQQFRLFFGKVREFFQKFLLEKSQFFSLLFISASETQRQAHTIGRSHIRIAHFDVFIQLKETIPSHLGFKEPPFEQFRSPIPGIFPVGIQDDIIGKNHQRVFDLIVTDTQRRVLPYFNLLLVKNIQKVLFNLFRSHLGAGLPPNSKYAHVGKQFFNNIVKCHDSAS